MLVLFVVYYVGTNLLSGSFGQQTVDVSLSDFTTQLDSGHVVSVTIQDHDITGKLDHQISGNGTRSDQFHTVYPFNDDAALYADLQKNNVKIVGKQSGAGDIWITLLFNLGPILLLVLLLIWLSRRATQSQQNIFNFGRSRAKLIMEDRPTTTFADIAGVDEAKAELEEVVEFLKTPQKFQRLGGKIPKGVLLVLCRRHKPYSNTCRFCAVMPAP